LRQTSPRRWAGAVMPLRGSAWAVTSSLWIGMRQHMNFGMFIRKIYVDQMKFLSPTYSSKEGKVWVVLECVTWPHK
ncbi:hypothetical protein TELCIR_18800, partial [Teladorsagia circumcincta]